MKINEILIESKEQLDEGPLGSLGTAVGKGVGGLAKGVGAVAGGIAGIGRAVKKGFQTGKATVAGDPDPNADPAAPTGGAAAQPAAAPASGGAPAQTAPAQTAPAPAAGAAPTAQQINQQGPAGTAPAKAQTGAAGAALAKTTAAVDQQTTDKAGQTVYAQVKANIDKLDKKGKQRILQLLQKSVTAPAAKPAAGAAPAAATPGASPKAGGTGFGFNPDTGKPFASAAERTAYDASPEAKMPTAGVEKAAAEPAAVAPTAVAPAQAAPAAEVPAKKTRTASRVPKKVALSQAELDAEREAKMGPTSDSINRTGNRLAEAFAKKVNQHKQRMVAEEIATGNFNFFKK